MRILLIIPDGRIHKISLGPFSRSMREAPLTLTMLASLTPPDLDVSLKLVDENVEKIPLNFNADLVGISVITGTSKRAYELAGYFRRKGIPVVLGGVHVTLMPEEAGKYADCIVVGTAERTWPRLLHDFNRGSMKKLYREIRPQPETLEGLPLPRRDLQRYARYNIPNTVMATRGCRNSCDFCTIPALLEGYAKRPVHDVIRDIKNSPGKFLVFNDVSLVDDIEYAKELFTALIPMGKRWGGLATARVSKSPELVELMAKSGCRYLLVGFESADQSSLKRIGKGFNRQNGYKDFMRMMHGNGISIQGCFILGFDEDDRSVFEATVNTVLDLGIDIPRFSILTPYPGTRLFEKLKAEKRIFTYDWEYYDTMHVVYDPAKMSAEELYHGFKWAYRETFRFSHILRRSTPLRFTSIINLVGNLNYRRFAKQLAKSCDSYLKSAMHPAGPI